MQIQINYVPNAKQMLLHESPCIETIYGGAKGGGKSCGLIMETLAYAIQNVGAECYLFRETYDNLERNLIREWFDKVPKELYKYHGSKHLVTLYNGSKVYFRYVKSLVDAKGYQGSSIDFIGVDELTKHEEEVIQELLSCLRSPQGFKVRFVGTCNPGGIGHHWVKKRYITPTLYGKHDYRDLETNNSIRFIPATVYDNNVLMNNDPNYVKRLENLPWEQREAYLHGNWDIYEGMAFEKWNEKIHVVDPFPIPKWWRRWRACDNGYTDPFYWLWYALSDDGTIYVYREFTRSTHDEKLTYKQQAIKVKEKSTYTEIENGEPVEVEEKLDYTVVGHDAWAKSPMTKQSSSSETGKCILDYYYEGGLTGFIKPILDRRLRYATALEYLEPFQNQEGELTAKVKIFRNCKTLIEQLPLQVRDEDDPEKVAESSIDHSYDCFTYGIISHHAKKSKEPHQYKGIIDKHKSEMVKKQRTKRIL